MATPAKSCGRKFIHRQHVWQEPVLNAAFASWPEFLCHGVETGQTEQEFLRGLHIRIQEMRVEATEETTDEAAQRFAAQIEAIKQLIGNPANYTKHPNIEPSVPVASIKAILED